MNRRDLKNFTNSLTMKQVEKWMADNNLKDCRHMHFIYNDKRKLLKFYSYSGQPNHFDWKDRFFDANLKEVVREFDPLKRGYVGYLMYADELVCLPYEDDTYIYVREENLSLFEQCPICGSWRIISRRLQENYNVDGKHYCERCFNRAKLRGEIYYCYTCNKFHLYENMITYTYRRGTKMICKYCLDKAMENGTLACDVYSGELFSDECHYRDGYDNPVCEATFYDKLVVAFDGKRYPKEDLIKVFNANGKEVLVVKAHFNLDDYVEINGAYYDKNLIVEVNGEKVCLMANKMPIYGYHNWDGQRKFKKMPGENTEMYFGIELETTGNRINTAAIKLNATDDIYHLERDGSLPDESFEIISQPMTWNYLKSRYEDIKKTFDMLIALNQRSDETSCCGLHVHVSRKAFKNEDAIKRAIAIITYFQKNNEIIARRKSNDYYRYQYIGGVITKEKVTCEEGHYTAVNCGNTYGDKNTIEFRIFKGTLNVNTYFATVEFVKNVVEMANSDVKRFAYSELLNGEYLPAYVQNRLSRNYPLELDKVIDLQGWNNNTTKAQLQEKWKIVQMLKEYNTKHPENRICNHTLRVGGAF